MRPKRYVRGCVALLPLLGSLCEEAWASGQGESVCAVTQPNRQTPPGEKSLPTHHGDGALWVQLWPDGTVIFKPSGPGEIKEDGSLTMKFPWWRGVKGQLTIEGRRLDAISPPLKARIPAGYGAIGFQSTALVFPAEGCWEVTGKVGNGSLTFVTRVVKEPGH